MATSILTMTLTLLIASFIAALPLLRLRQARAAWQGTLGSLCLAAGCGMFFAFCSGFLGDFGTASVFAADSGEKDSAESPPAAPAKSAPLEYAECAGTASKENREESQANAPAGELNFVLPVSNTSKSGESNTATILPEGQLHTAPNVNPDTIVIPPGRPEWVGKNVTVGSEHSIAVCSGLFSTQAEADLELDRVLRKRTDEYIAEQLGNSFAPQLVGYDLPKIKRELVKSQNVYHEQVSVPSTGPMQQVHALLEFDPDFRQRITSQWHDLTAYYRLLQTGLVAGGALLFLGTIFSYFRLDNATRGYYTGRLQFMTAAAILAIVGSGAVLARWIYWL